MPRKLPKRRICFVTGTRAEFGLMQTTLRAIEKHPKLRLQLLITGMHLDTRHGKSVNQIRAQGWLKRCDHALIPWKPAGQNPTDVAQATGNAVAAMARQFTKLKPDIVLIVGDRVEAFAGAAAAHISAIPVAHVHGGDRALGQVDDALRHAITKLAHLHFPATDESANRITRLGEDRWRIHAVGSPGIDNIAATAASIQKEFPPARRGKFALLVLHPTDADDQAESRRAMMLLNAIRKTSLAHTVIVYPNNDPGSRGIIRCWKNQIDPNRETVLTDVPRPQFLGLLRDAAVLLGNSSSGIIEAASFGTPVLNVGLRQLGRQCGKNVSHIPFNAKALQDALDKLMDQGQFRRYPSVNVYGTGTASRAIASILSRIPLNTRLIRKLIAN